MTRKRLLVAFGGLFGLLTLAVAPVGAVPPCSIIGATDCNATCQILGRGSCYSWSIGTCDGGSAQYTYYCQSGPPFTGWCSGCGGGGGGCFLAGTKIAMADGSTKPIENIRVGDVVLSFDEISSQFKPDKVAAVADPTKADHHLVVNGSMLLTPTHPVRSKGDWVEIGNLKIGDTLTAADGSAVPIKSIEKVDGEVTVYNFTVNPYGTYIANGIIVHNKNPKIIEPPPEGGGD
jgi:hypothetical protein